MASMARIRRDAFVYQSHRSKQTLKTTSKSRTSWRPLGTLCPNVPEVTLVVPMVKQDNPRGQAQ
jgi:hypothetical protein